MIPKNKLKVVYGIVIYLLFVGVLCYAAFPVKPPDEPVRLMFKVTAGKVIFDQKHTLPNQGMDFPAGIVIIIPWMTIPPW